MKKGDYIFVYGTLRRGQRADLQKQAHNFGVKFCGEDHINGKMYHLGAFPGVKTKPFEVFTETEPYLKGEVFLVLQTAMIALMDAYEGYNADDPKSGLYDRIETKSASGKTVWVYVYNGPVISDQLVESGDWCKNPDMPAIGRRLRA